MAFAQEDAWDDLAREEDHLDHRNYHAVMLACGKALRAIVPSLPPLKFAQWVAIYLARRWVVQPWSIPGRPNARGEIWEPPAAPGIGERTFGVWAPRVLNAGLRAKAVLSRNPDEFART